MKAFANKASKFPRFVALAWIACRSLLVIDTADVSAQSLLDSMQVKYLTLEKSKVDSLGIQKGDFVMSEDAFEQARQEVALQRSIAQVALNKLKAQEREGERYRASLESLQKRMEGIVQEKDALIRRLNERYDSLNERQNAEIEQVAIDLEIHEVEGETLKKESFKTEMEALRSADELEKQIKRSDQVVGEWLKKKSN